MPPHIYQLFCPQEMDIVFIGQSQCIKGQFG